MTEDYLASWMLYLVAVAGCCTVWWRILYEFKWKHLAWITAVMLAAILLAPSRVDPALNDWSPAFMAALLEFISGNTETASRHLRSMLMAFLLSVLGVLLVLRKRNQNQIAPEKDNSQSGSEQA